MSAAPGGRDGDIEALIVDRYLESLLARRPMDPDGVPPELDATARRIAGALPRFHPSFRFEEQVAARLAAAAGRITAGEVVAFPIAGGRTTPGDLAERSFVGRPAVIGGVLTSAAISLAGAAYVAWRRNRSSLPPMTRAARAVTRARLI